MKNEDGLEGRQTCGIDEMENETKDEKLKDGVEGRQESGIETQLVGLEDR